MKVKLSIRRLGSNFNRKCAASSDQRLEHIFVCFVITNYQRKIIINSIDDFFQEQASINSQLSDFNNLVSWKNLQILILYEFIQFGTQFLCIRFTFFADLR